MDIAEKILKEFETELCDKYNVYPFDGCTGTAPTGEAYITYSYSDYGNSALSAVNMYIQRVSEALPGPKSRHHSLYWRTRPEIIENEGRYKVRSRFLLSDKRFFMPKGYEDANTKNEIYP